MPLEMNQQLQQRRVFCCGRFKGGQRTNVAPKRKRRPGTLAIYGQPQAIKRFKHGK